ncbi:MAG: GT2 family glycosyltransferase [Hyphomicrobiaceae bacterium]|jgi:GT2 family glycosyltransferase
MPRLTVIVLNWNGRNLLTPCLESVRAQTAIDEIELIVVDNGSTDGSVDLVEADFPEAHLIRQDHNTGFCHGNNVGMEVARGDLILLLNNDAELAADFAACVIAGADEHPQMGMFATRVRMFDRPEIFDSTGLLVYPDGVCRSRGWLEKDMGQYDEREEVLGPNGCAAVYRRAMLDDVGLFDEGYFAYLEDLDLAMRGQLRGWHCLYLPEAEAVHKKSMTSGYHSAFKAYHVERNRIWNAMRLFPLRLLALSPFYTLARYLAQGSATAAGKGISSSFRRDYSRSELAWILIRAYGNAFARAPEVWRQRRAIQARRRLGALDVYLLMRRYRLPLSELAFKD